jgi:hypothetical protein
MVDVRSLVTVGHAGFTASVFIIAEVFTLSTRSLGLHTLIDTHTKHLSFLVLSSLSLYNDTHNNSMEIRKKLRVLKEMLLVKGEG